MGRSGWRDRCCILNVPGNYNPHSRNSERWRVKVVQSQPSVNSLHKIFYVFITTWATAAMFRRLVSTRLIWAIVTFTVGYVWLEMLLAALFFLPSEGLLGGSTLLTNTCRSGDLHTVFCLEAFVPVRDLSRLCPGSRLMCVWTGTRPRTPAQRGKWVSWVEWWMMKGLTSVRTAARGQHHQDSTESNIRYFDTDDLSSISMLKALQVYRCTLRRHYSV